MGCHRKKLYHVMNLIVEDHLEGLADRQDQHLRSLGLFEVLELIFHILVPILLFDFVSFHQHDP